MYEIYVAASFEAAHRLVGDFGPATRLHGHTYRLEVVVRGE
ncbi:MAG TPA: 6-carboxytetrahydropterin synthase, partial [Rubrobacter sp.]|nr:6-carboxytetrahydropterin synthase [Rubrobacter sp.]